MLARANGIEIAYESMGRPEDPPVLLIMGYSVQMIAWDDAFCRMLVARGLRIVRFDNRDVGLSTKCGEAPYSLDDMAEDARGLLDWLELPTAHVVGASMGGMIAQLLALAHPSRVRSLCSIMSTTGDLRVGYPTPSALAALLRPPIRTREEAADRAEETFRVIGSPGYPPATERVRARAMRSFDRCHHPAGAARQLRAVQAARPRTAALAQLRMPTLVMHGDADPLVHVSGGEATARAIPGARLVVFPGMGHELPEPLWPALCDLIVENVRRGEAP